MDGDGFKRVSDDKSVDISKLPEDDKGLYYKDEPYTTKKLQQRLIITYSPKYALYQKSIRSKQIERAQAMLDSGNTKRTAGTQTIQPDLLEQQQLQKKVRLPISSIILPIPPAVSIQTQPGKTEALQFPMLRSDSYTSGILYLRRPE